MGMDRADACEQQAKDANLRAEKAEEEVRDLQKKMQQLESDLDVTQEKLLNANQMLEEDLEKSEERLLIATQKLDQASTAADDNQRMCKKLATVEGDLDRAEERADTSEHKIIELEEELRVVGNNLKSLEVSEEKANQREEAYKEQIKTLTAKLKQAEARAEFA